MNEEGSAAGQSVREVEYLALGRQIATQVGRLQRGALANESWAVAALAQLRRGVGKDPGELVELLEWTSPGVFVDADQSDEITNEERAAHLALTLYALHQQGHSGNGMHRGSGESIGGAARKLRAALGERGEDGVLRRFNAIGTATNPKEVARHAQGLITQLRAAAIPLDYATFADDLRKLMDPSVAAGVRNRWGRHFHRYTPAKAKD